MASSAWSLEGSRTVIDTIVPMPVLDFETLYNFLSNFTASAMDTPIGHVVKPRPTIPEIFRKSLLSIYLCFIDR